MAELLRRSLSPITAEGWKEIDETTAEVLRTQLTARSLIDFDGPHGWEYAAVNLGRLDTATSPGPEGVPWGQRKVLPLLELRIPCVLSQMELDLIPRGCADVDLEPLREAALKLAKAEEAIVYQGFEEAGIAGIVRSSEHAPLPLSEPGDYPAAVARAVELLHRAGIPGPYALVLGFDRFAALKQAGAEGYPPERIIREQLGGRILASPALEGGVVLSTAGGHFQFVAGQDISVGYSSHDRDEVELYLTESFTFRVIEPKAAVVFSLE